MAYLPDLPRADDDGVLAVHDEPYAPLGSCYRDQQTGYVYQYLKAAEALQYGDALEATALHTITDLATAAAVGSTELNDSGETFLTSLARVKKTSRQKEMAMLSVIGGTGAGQTGIITEIQNTRLIVEWNTEDGTLGTALDNTSDIRIFATWLASRTDAAGAPTVGFAQQRDGVAQDKYFWALYEGKGIYRAGAAVAEGNALTPDATAGRLAPIAATNLNPACGWADHVAADGARGWASLKANILVGEVPVVTDIGYQASTTAPPATGSA